MIGADADKVAELVLGRVFCDALRVLPTTSASQHRRHHPDAAGSSSAPPCREKKEEPKEEWKQIPPELLKETLPWWVEHREMLAKLSRHPDDRVDAPGLALAIAHSLARLGGAAGGATDGQPVFDISDSDEDVKPDVKTEDGDAGSSTGGRRGGGRGRYGG
jgi:hypothetical protein